MAKRKAAGRGFTLKPTDRPAKIKEVDGITINLARWRKQDARLHDQLHKSGQDFLGTAHMVERMVIAWPFSEDITALNFLNLGETNARRVVQALYRAIKEK